MDPEEEGDQVGGGKGQVVAVCRVWVVADDQGVQKGALGRGVQDQVEVHGPWVQVNP